MLITPTRRGELVSESIMEKNALLCVFTLSLPVAKQNYYVSSLIHCVGTIQDYNELLMETVAS